MRRTLVLVWIIALSLVLAACAASYSTYFDSDPDAPYTLASGDRLRIIVYGQEGLSNSYSVDGSGHIEMPLIGIVTAEGKTTAALGKEIEANCRTAFCAIRMSRWRWK
ncbi:MAG TPA: polysaccharide biosynthesis/export family protein, partial [Methylovirgula sp.]|nr:polysaccharide biosynthesis/export family protein [Methylovirgula sp.]